MMLLQSSRYHGLKKSHRLVTKVMGSQSVRSMTILSKESKEEYEKKNYTQRMKDKTYPVSPNVTIYAFPIGAISSITNRVTGTVLSVGCAGLGAAELVGGSGTALSLMQSVGSQGFLVASLAKFSVAFPLLYHYGAGVRHAVWDVKPDFLTNPDVERSSYYLFGGSLVLSSVFALFV